ncbi:flavin reductase family protein [Nocardioides jiangxiensis]|uniref:Flavin reductase family protein n=1 Tax=Nocardioides jiangxiensis TaxID=3064524 RepID=A0ABT9B3B5_9ACTN|nr:flavin reductase family protein [Nocardioides sp. WY-20]MDO7869304.1 flavin reductase family protein [Nocardioides sp. WY-20]
MTIHSSHPFAMPEDAARRLRGRLGGTVSLWTAGAGATRAGLTVSSLMVATGDPAYVLALVDPDSDLFDALETTGRAVVQLLRRPHRELADMFAGMTPAPGGVFRQAEFEQGTWGPVLADATTWAGVVLESAVEVGWSMQVTCRIEHVVLGEEPDPLVHRRGRYVMP